MDGTCFFLYVNFYRPLRVSSLDYLSLELMHGVWWHERDHITDLHSPSMGLVTCLETSELMSKNLSSVFVLRDPLLWFRLYFSLLLGWPWPTSGGVLNMIAVACESEQLMPQRLQSCVGDVSHLSNARQCSMGRQRSRCHPCRSHVKTEMKMMMMIWSLLD